MITLGTVGTVWTMTLGSAQGGTSVDCHNCETAMAQTSAMQFSAQSVKRLQYAFEKDWMVPL